jgi:hypothetical protein
MKRRTKKEKVSALSRRDLNNMLADLKTRLEAHALDLEAIQHANKPNDSDLVVEHLSRMAFRMALNHQALRLQSIVDFARAIHDRALDRKAVRG